MNFDNDTFLANELRSGNCKAYDFLMDKHYQKLCVYAHMLVHDHDSAEDIVQNVLVKVWVGRKKIDPNKSINNYLHRAVYNEFVDLYRKSKPVVYLEKKYIETLDQVVEEESESIENLIQMINREIDKLPPKCKRIFLLNKKEGLTHLEISEYLDVSVKTVEGHITRAFKILSKKLSNKMSAMLFLLFRMQKWEIKNGS